MKEYNINTIYQSGHVNKGRGSLVYQSDYISGCCFWDNDWMEGYYKIYNYDVNIIFNV